MRNNLFANMVFAFCVAVCLFLSPAARAAGNSVAVLQTDPATPATLGKWENLDFRIGYTSDRLIRVRVRAFSNGTAMPSITGGEGFYGPGDGEAFFWLSYLNPVSIDRVDVEAIDDATGTVIASVSQPVRFSWTGARAAKPRTPEPWVQALQDDMTRRNLAEWAQRKSNEGPAARAWDAFSAILTTATIWSVPGYLLLQVIFLWRWRGRWRGVAAVPIVPMGAILLFVIYAGTVKGSNLAPILIIFAAPFAFLYLIGAWVLRRINGAG